MGKYKLKVDFSESFEKQVQLLNIANELAEANRLKRLELRKYTDLPDLLDREELEDKA